MGNLESIAQQTARLQLSPSQLYTLTRGVRNPVAVEQILSKSIAVYNPEREWHDYFDYKRNGLQEQVLSMLNLGVYKPLEVGGKVVDPVETIHEMISVAGKGYEMVQRRLESIAANAFDDGTYNPRHFTMQAVHTLWYREFRRLIQQEVALANDVALWMHALTKRNDVVGRNAPKKLAELGITDVQALPQDIRMTGEKLLRFYDSYEQHQLNQYQ